MQVRIHKSVFYILGIILALVVGIRLGYMFDRGQDVIKVETKTIEVPRGRTDTSTDACVKAGGVPTYSAWDGGLNGCIYVGQSNRDSNVELNR